MKTETNIKTISMLHNSMTLPLQSTVIRTGKDSNLNFSKIIEFTLLMLHTHDTDAMLDLQSESRGLM